MRCAAWLALAVGRPVARLLLHGLSLYFVAASAVERAASRQFLRRALGREPGLADLYRHFHAFATTILDRVYLLNGQFAYFDVRVHGEEIVAGMLARREGCLLVGSHLGSFEIVRFLGHHAQAPRVTLVMYEAGTRQLNAVLDAINPRLAMRVIALGHLDTMLQVERALADGEFVGMLADRAIEWESTAECSFLGAPARLPLGPFRVAAMLKRPIVLMFGVFRGGRRYDIHFELLADLGAVARANRDRAIRDAQRCYVQRLEHYCRLAPYNWFNFYDFWK